MNLLQQSYELLKDIQIVTILIYMQISYPHTTIFNAEHRKLSKLFNRILNKIENCFMKNTLFCFNSYNTFHVDLESTSPNWTHNGNF